MAIFASPTISADFNANAPPDDGSQTAANEVDWSKIKTKLADPIKSYVDSLVTDTSNAFGKVAFSSVAAKSADYTVTSSDSGKLLSCTNSITITLLDPATAGNGFSIFVSNDGSGTVVVSGGGYGTLWGSSALNLLAGDAVILTTDESNWQGVVGHRTILRAAVAETITGSWTFSGAVSFASTISSSKSADSGYARVEPNYCRVINRSFSSNISAGDFTITAPSGATWVEVMAYFSTTSASDIATFTAYYESARTNVVDVAYFEGAGAQTDIGKKILVKVNSGTCYLNCSLSGSGVAKYAIVGYYD